MDTYTKIDTLYDRDTQTFTVIPGQYRRPEFALVKTWRLTEKIDGTNIRIIFRRWTDNPPMTYEIRGRTDKAQIPAPLLKVLTEIAEHSLVEVSRIMEEHSLTSYTLYGEGYGPGIQSGGYYRENPSFILFDVKANDVWLSDGQVFEAAVRLEIDRVPDLLNPYSENREWEPDPLDWTEEDIVRYVSSGDCQTTFAKDTREAEGIIAKTQFPLYNQRGQRVMFKLKGSDFRAGKR